MSRFADINFTPSSRALILTGMWETNTFGASFHARLNVASAVIAKQKQR
jgi:hypothetical protein